MTSSSNGSGLVEYCFTATIDAPADPEQRRSSLWPDTPAAVANALMDASLQTESGQRLLAARGHATRTETAGWLHRGILTLNPHQCAFAPRNVTLAGEVNVSSPAQASAVILELLQWTLTQVYGAEADSRNRVALTGLELAVREHRPIHVI